MLLIRATSMAMVSADKARCTKDNTKQRQRQMGKAKGKGKRLSSALIWTHSWTCVYLSVCVYVYSVCVHAKRLQNISIESHDYLHATRGPAACCRLSLVWLCVANGKLNFTLSENKPNRQQGHTALWRYTATHTAHHGKNNKIMLKTYNWKEKIHAVVVVARRKFSGASAS